MSEEIYYVNPIKGTKWECRSEIGTGRCGKQGKVMGVFQSGYLIMYCTKCFVSFVDAQIAACSAKWRPESYIPTFFKQNGVKCYSCRSTKKAIKKNEQVFISGSIIFCKKCHSKRLKREQRDMKAQKKELAMFIKLKQNWLSKLPTLELLEELE